MFARIKHLECHSSTFYLKLLTLAFWNWMVDEQFMLISLAKPPYINYIYMIDQLWSVRSYDERNISCKHVCIIGVMEASFFGDKFNGYCKILTLFLIICLHFNGLKWYADESKERQQLYVYDVWFAQLTSNSWGTSLETNTKYIYTLFINTMSWSTYEFVLYGTPKHKTSLL